jgi:glycosyltransferase involved in cell wall biosynthesis
VLAKLLVQFKFRYNYTPHGAFNTVALKRSACKKRVYISLHERFLVKRAHKIHLIGESEVLGTKNVFKQFDYALIQNGQDMSPITAPFSNNRKSVPVFGFVGRLDAHTKGLDLLIQAFAEWVEKTGVVAELRLLGDGPDKGALEEMAQGLGIASMVKMLGPKYGEEKIAEMKQFDFLCLNSRNEGLPGVVLEAAELGVPALVSKETNMGTFIQSHKAGFVSAKNSVEGMIEILEKAFSAMEEPLQYHQMSGNAIQMIKQEFDWKMIAEKHVVSYA